MSRLDQLLDARARFRNSLARIERAIDAELLRIRNEVHPDSPLTSREEEVLRLLQSHPGWGNKHVAAELNVSERTVKFHVSGLLAKFKKQSRREL